jgi:mandelate racemase
VATPAGAIVSGWMRAAALAQGAGIELSSHRFAEASAKLLPVTSTYRYAG